MTDWPDKPSVYMPLRRWFTNERERELQETRDVYASLRPRQSSLAATPLSVGAEVYEHFDYAPEALHPPLCQAMDALIRGEQYIFELPEPQLERMSLKEFVDYRNLLKFKEYFFANEETMLRLLHECLVRIFCAVADMLPQAEDPSPFTIPLIYTIPEPRTFVQQLFNTMAEDQYRDRAILKDVSEQLYRNICDASGIVPGQETKKPYKTPVDSDLPLDEFVNQYLAGTPFRDLFLTPVPLKLTHEDRFNHMHVVGGTGAGKTTLLENLIAHDFNSPDCPSLVIVDSQGDLIGKLSRLERFHPDYGEFRDRFLLITPKDPAPARPQHLRRESRPPRRL